MTQEPELFFTRLIGSVPSALFVLVPVFALLLKFAYIETRRVYLEHLVVALYSHVFLLIMLTLAFVLSAANSRVSSTPGSFSRMCTRRTRSNAPARRCRRWSPARCAARSP